MTLHIDDRVAAALQEQARAQGLSLDAYLQLIAQTRNLPQSLETGPDDARNFDAALDELFAHDARRLPATSLSYTRQDIYLDHD